MVLTMSAFAGMVAATVLAAIAALHGYWALGGVWPGRDAEGLTQTVVGARPGTPPPGPAACWLVAALLLGGAITVLGAAGVLPLPVPARAVRVAALLGGGVLALRGLLGFADARLRPDIRGSPYARWNVRLYSPLCLVLALLIGGAAR